MKTEILNYELPAELIAQQPCKERTGSKLLVLDRNAGELTDSQFSKLGSFLKSGDCLVLNNTKVLPARFFARRKSGAKIEGIFLAEKADGRWLVMLKNARKLKPGELFFLKDINGDDFCQIELVEKLQQGQCLINVKNPGSIEEILNKTGFAPLPPYIKRTDNNTAINNDKDRYQTIYAQNTGAVAAPTAGLHFSETLIEQLKTAGIRFAYVTLHVGAGTFKPVTAENLEDHKMHFESFELTEKNAEIINQTKLNGSRVIAVGTTSVRTLESIAENNTVKPSSGQTNLFITPGCKFKIIDTMITNFHLPKSTLLALVAAFAGLDITLKAYKHAIENRYRFYSYGDAMLIV